MARRFPRPDVAPLVRKLPRPVLANLDEAPLTQSIPPPPPPLASSGPPRPLSTPLSADRYQIRFTAGGATLEKVRLAQDLLRHAVPSGDPAEIVDRALTALIDDLAKKKCGRASTTARPSAPRPPGRATSLRMVRREVWVRDRGLCAFVAKSGRRCSERRFLEFHHVEPYAVGGPATAANIQLRCRAHNALEAVSFGPTRPGASWTPSERTAEVSCDGSDSSRNRHTWPRQGARRLSFDRDGWRREAARGAAMSEAQGEAHQVAIVTGAASGSTPLQRRRWPHAPLSSG